MPLDNLEFLLINGMLSRNIVCVKPLTPAWSELRMCLCLIFLCCCYCLFLKQRESVGVCQNIFHDEDNMPAAVSLSEHSDAHDYGKINIFLLLYRL